MSITIEHSNSLSLYSQQVFRVVLEALSRPLISQQINSVVDCDANNAPINPILFTLCDMDTTVWIQDSPNKAELENYIRFYCGAKLVDNANEADFVIINDPFTMPALESFKQGSLEYPDKSATLLIVTDLNNKENKANKLISFSGPGIKEAISYSFPNLPCSFWKNRKDQEECYPLGVDILFVDSNKETDTYKINILGLPRSTRIQGSDSEDKQVQEVSTCM
ncbi:phosphonate C-P lyase system protein PhnH [Desulfovibrio litoralis]|uniref:Alpha-D-ribose 1-methylphosphonate 5-triphosphate synthase subunit PhnH n=1 Tax=Desulfovibrio litoralis DSM 11393 TaxID=1121455 RepID=A0A1M7SSS7_9BACT|nr:phosphonate C-P lyase system protein PhnH [Desulfovibrio litoralis]SHN61565.1 alpha-D-ribose 1-methylphosphonate 5-triphosphate synthase subunit PhnH [Desulfovibrio litoralis DSM 11393]